MDTLKRNSISISILYSARMLLVVGYMVNRKADTTAFIGPELDIKESWYKIYKGPLFIKSATIISQSRFHTHSVLIANAIEL